MTTRHRTPSVAAVVCLLAVALAGCGSSSGKRTACVYSPAGAHLCGATAHAYCEQYPRTGDCEAVIEPAAVATREGLYEEQLNNGLARETQHCKESGGEAIKEGVVINCK